MKSLVGGALALCLASASAAQDVRSFIRQPGGAAWADGPELLCQWRSPLRSRGGHVDGYNNNGKASIYARIPVPPASVQTNLQFGSRSDLAQVIYIELFGHSEHAEGLGGPLAFRWDQAVLVIPPLAGGARQINPLSWADITIGGVRAVQPIVTSYPGLQTRVTVSGEDLREMVAGLATAASMAGKVSTLEDQRLPATPRISFELPLPGLWQDLEMIRARSLEMQGLLVSDDCKVPAESCADGLCGWWL